MRKLYQFLFEYDLNSGPSPAVPVISIGLRLRRDAAWMVLLSYLLLICNMTLPVIADGLAHTFWEKEHLATVHQAEGNAHLAHQLARSGNEAPKDKATAGAKVSADDIIHLPETAGFNFTQLSYSLAPARIYFNSASVPAAPGADDDPPPESVA